MHLAYRYYFGTSVFKRSLFSIVNSIFDEVFKYIDLTQRFSTFEDMIDTSTDN